MSSVLVPFFDNDIIIIFVKTEILFLSCFFFTVEFCFTFVENKKQERDRTPDDKNKGLFISSYSCLVIKHHDFPCGKHRRQCDCEGTEAHGGRALDP